MSEINLMDGWLDWRHLANTIELVLPSAHPSPRPNDKSIGSAVFALGAHFLQSCPFAHMVIWTPSDLWFLGPVRAHNPNGITIGSAVFAQITVRPYSVRLQWDPLSSWKLPIPVRDLDLHLIHGSLSPPESSTQTASRPVQPFLHDTTH